MSARSDGLATISVVIPTMNRPTLARTVASAKGADEIIVVGDRVKPTAGDVRLVKKHPKTSSPAARAAELRNKGMRHGTCDWFAFMDDDDVFTPGAIDVIRRVVSRQTPALYLFRMTFGGNDVRWHWPVIALGDVGTPMIVCPAKGWRPWPMDLPGEDYHFAWQNRNSWPGGVVFREEVIARIRPS